VERGVLILGSGIASVQAALDLADSRIKVYLVERSPSIDEKEFLSGDLSLCPLEPRRVALAGHPYVHLLTCSEVTQVTGENGHFRVRVLKRPRYIDEDICNGCGRCAESCPVTVWEDGRERKAIYVPSPRSVPFIYTIEKKGIPPCRAACPADVNVQGYVALIRKGKYAEALALIREANPLPGVCGRVCNHPCEEECRRGEIDEPVSICALKRFVADYEMQTGERFTLPKPEPRQEKVAIVGSGPAGLTAAYNLAKWGYQVTIFEALPVVGGMLWAGIPAYRLPREVIQRDVDFIKSLGVEIKTNTPIGDGLTLDDLSEQGYKAILLAIGAHKGRKLGVPGEDLEGVMDCVDFLRKVNLGQDIKIGKKVVVIGGGNAAIDSARVALRLGCEEVCIVYRRSRKEMPANEWEVQEAEKEGVKIHYLAAPTKIFGENGRVSGMECIRMRLGEPDSSGRRRPIPIEGSEFIIDVDTVIPAIGQSPDLSFLPEGNGLEVTRWGTLAVDPDTLATTRPGVFAAGDAVTGPATVIQAIAAGKEAAISIDRWLRGVDLKEGRKVERRLVDTTEKVELPKGMRKVRRQQMPKLPVDTRITGFEEVELGFDEKAAIKEAERCLNCGVCSECGECIRACDELKAIRHEQEEEEIELEVGAILVEPSPKVEYIADVIGLKTVEGRAFAEVTSRFAPLESLKEGIYLCGNGRVLEDLSKRASYGSAAAAKAMIPLAKYRLPEVTKKAFSTSLNGQPPRIGVFVCHAGGNISKIIDVKEIIEYARRLPNVVYVQDLFYACAGNSADVVRSAIQSHNLNRVVLASCACCSLDQICTSCSHQRVRLKKLFLEEVGLDSRFFEPINIREHCAWVHANEPARATAKAQDMIWMAVSKVSLAEAFEVKFEEVEKSALVVGGDIGGIETAINLASQGFKITLIEKGSELGSKFTRLKSLAPYQTSPTEVLQEKLTLLEKTGVTVLRNTEIVDVKGHLGNFKVTISGQEGEKKLKVGAIILASETESYNVVESELVKSKRQGVFVCSPYSSQEDLIDSYISALEAAAKAAVLLSKGRIESNPMASTVDEVRCRGCGVCVEVCEYGAPKLIDRGDGVFVSQIDEFICRGCGTCAALCPTGAAEVKGFTDQQLESMMESLLTK